jgi:hypothetical protein
VKENRSPARPQPMKLRSTSRIMKLSESFSDSFQPDQSQLAERELASFIAAVTELFGSEQAKLSAEAWLDEFELSDTPPVVMSQYWRNITIKASTRLVSRVNTPSAEPTVAVDTKVAQLVVGRMLGARS